MSNYTTAEILAEIETYFQSVWAKKPEDMATLEALTLPPMGNMPCTLYCSFNLFWLGESMQAMRAAAQKQSASLETICFAIAEEFGRHASRLVKWHVPHTEALVVKLQDYFAACTPVSYEEFITVITKALVAIDTMQNWIDSAIPWSKMDAALGGLNHVWTGKDE